LLNKFKEPVTAYPYSWKNWKYFRPADQYLPDPRAVISKHIDWTLTFVERPTSCPGIEPHDYTLGICHDKPVDIDYIKDQCFFFDKKTQMWISMYYFTDNNTALKFNRELIKIQPLALWTNPKRSRIPRKKKTLIELDGFKSRKVKTAVASERLAQMGYYSILKDKYFHGNEEYVDARVGIARAVSDELEDEIEEDFYDSI